MISEKQRAEILERLDEVDITGSKHYEEVEASRKFDADGTLFATKQLTYAETVVQMAVEPDLVYKEVFPVDYSGGEGLDSLERRMGLGEGEAKPIGNAGADFPRVSYREKPLIEPVVPYGLEYGITVRDLKKAQRAKTNIDTKLIEETNRGMERGADKCAWEGDESVRGFLDATYLSKYSSVTFDAVGNSRGGTNSRKLRHMTAAQIEEQILKLLDAANASLSGAANGFTYTLAVGPDDYTWVTALKSGTLDSALIPTYLRQIGITKIISCPKLKAQKLLGTGGGTADGVFLIPQSSRVLSVRFPVQKQAMPAYLDKGWEWVTKYTFDSSGTHVYLPTKIAYTKY